jgi:hypothetical protein
VVEEWDRDSGFIFEGFPFWEFGAGFPANPSCSNSTRGILILCMGHPAAAQWVKLLELED